ncbi:Fic family protein [Cysteiniphilum sp. JM-1]|uniref:Fic family protein n=1 Tax=Cysteiniphilum sp. JM-1 TaxID=2610891 RepID=UPI0012461812|nr:Fic family protein [Cysteiniphilum sp. JM-1]
MPVFLNISGYKKKQDDSIIYEDECIECKSYDYFYAKLVSFLKEEALYRGEIKEFEVKNINTEGSETITFRDMKDHLNIIRAHPDKYEIFPIIDGQGLSADELFYSLRHGGTKAKPNRKSLETANGKGTYVAGELEDHLVTKVSSVFTTVLTTQGLTESLIKQINKYLQLDNAINREDPLNPGIYRVSKKNYGIKAANIGAAMSTFIVRYRDIMGAIKPINLKSEDAGEQLKQIVSLAAKMHTDLVKIHPFDNCNGKVARVLVNLLLDNAELGFAPINHWSNAYKYAANEAAKEGSYGLLERCILEAIVYDGQYAHDYVTEMQKSAEVDNEGELKISSDSYHFLPVHHKRNAVILGEIALPSNSGTVTFKGHKRSNEILSEPEFKSDIDIIFLKGHKRTKAMIEPDVNVLQW